MVNQLNVNIMRIDLKIAYALANRANNYIRKQNLKKAKIEDELLDAHFVSNDKFIGKLSESLKIYYYKDSILSRYIYKGFEKDEIIFLCKYLKQGDTFLDLGANIGLFSLYAAEIVTETGNIHSFEPTPKTYSRLIENIELNNFQNIIITNNIGLSSNNGVLKLNVSTDGHDAWNTFVQQSEMKFENNIEISVEKLDDYLDSKKLSPDKIAFVKMDVEGWEMEVVKGAKKLLQDNNAPIFMVEFTESNLFAAGTNCYELYDVFASYGYKWYTYDVVKNLLLEDIKRIHYPYNNLFAIKNIDLARERIK